MANHDRIWVTWETQRRNPSMAAALGAELHVLDLPGNRVWRYLRSIGRTLALLLRRRPAQLFVQNPSIVLSTLAAVYGKLSRTVVVVDAHNSALEMLDARSGVLRAWTRWLCRAVDFTIVTNGALQQRVRGIGAKAEILPDPLPAMIPPVESLALTDKFNVLFVCTWAADEPFAEVIAAADLLGPSVTIYVTGNWRKVPGIEADRLPVNIVLTGFVPEPTYVEYLYAVDLIVDLTTRDDCLVCGAYEGIAAGKPVILSDKSAAKAYFGDRMVYTENDAGAIAAAIAAVRDNASLRDDTHLAAAAKAVQQRWDSAFERLQQALEAATA